MISRLRFIGLIRKGMHLRTLQFVSANLGKHVQSPGGLGGQCVDLTNLYLMDVVVSPQVHANAVDWRNAKITEMHWVDNTPANNPPFGAIVVWQEYAPHGIGVNGHIAIVVQSDENSLVTCDQNWLDNAPVSLVLHDYGGVLGWFTPNWP